MRSFAKKLMQTKPFKLVAVALANKMARVAFAIMRGKTTRYWRTNAANRVSAPWSERRCLKTKTAAVFAVSARR
jgi:hypothetical protein